MLLRVVAKELLLMKIMITSSRFSKHCIVEGRGSTIILPTEYQKTSLSPGNKRKINGVVASKKKRGKGEKETIIEFRRKSPGSE